MDRSKLFKAAWIAARRGALTLGGTPRQHFRLALVGAWEAAKAPKPAPRSWDEGRTAPDVTREQLDRVRAQTEGDLAARSEERRVGKEWFSTCSSRWSPYH